jgi:ankyrin repeat protein
MEVAMMPVKKRRMVTMRNLFCLGCAVLCLTGCVTPNKLLPISAEEKAYGYSLSLICDAAEENDLDSLTLLLDAKTDTEERIAGETPLMLAAKNGHVDAVKLLLDRGAQVNARNPEMPDSKRGMTALMLAAQQGHDEVVRMLLERGADVTIKTRFGRTALDLAVRAKNEKTVRLLKDFSSEVQNQHLRWQSYLRYEQQ